jgi:CBS domain containing-hemolysin-like protein
VGATNFAATAGTLLAALGLAEVLGDLPPPVVGATVVLFAVPLFGAVTYALPRALARRWPQPVVRGAVPWFDRLGLLLSPLLPGAAAERPELKSLLPGGEGSDWFERGELEILAGLMAFTERPVREIMTARTEIVAVEEGLPPSEVARIFADSGYSRLPVYRESLDNIVGVIYVFDLLKVAPGGSLRIRPVLTVPSSKACADLLFEMQRERKHFGVVLDEYGGTAGIVTLQDLLDALVEGIFGQLPAEKTGASEEVELLEADGSMRITDLAARFQVELAGGAETVAGLLIRALGRIPRAGERFVYQGLEFDVLEATPARVQRVVVRRAPVQEIVLPASGEL